MKALELTMKNGRRQREFRDQNKKYAVRIEIKVEIDPNSVLAKHDRIRRQPVGRALLNKSIVTEGEWRNKQVPDGSSQFFFVHGLVGHSTSADTASSQSIVQRDQLEPRGWFVSACNHAN
jgi:hypothetical protein